MNPQRLYLRDVLGIESWIRPAGAAPSFKMARTAPSTVTLVGRSDWSLDERSLVEKIVAASGLSGPFVGSEAILESRSRHVVIFDSQDPVGCRIENGRSVWSLGPLRRLLEGSPQEIQEAKRHVWNLLKSLKEELVSHGGSDV